MLINCGKTVRRLIRGATRYSALQSLRLSMENEQNLYNLAHFVVCGCVCPHLAASAKVGLNEYRKLSKLAS